MLLLERLLEEDDAQGTSDDWKKHTVEILHTMSSIPSFRRHSGVGIEAHRHLFVSSYRKLSINQC